MPANSHSDRARPLTLEAAEAEIARLQAQLSTIANDEGAREPIAVVGMGCRYPGGVNSPDEFWDLLSSGRDILRDIPNERWDVDAYYDPEITVPGKMYVRKGYYLDDIDQFDPQFFGLSPREAESLDPQQRLVMEVSWETLEHAGIAPDSLKGGKTGVFVGQYWDDYSAQRIYSTDNREIDRYAQLSALRGLTAGRICHVLDSHGPAMQLDTACSSSSLTVHLACQSLRAGESDLALAGGVSLVLAPEHLIGICQMTALSADGRCKTFDAGADGFGQGEGCGMVALKRLSDAQRDGDNVLAVIQGSAVNHDGHARTVTTPSGAAQRAMLEEALEDAGLEPHQIDFVETHGTGTPLGDPIEVMAIGRVLCEERTKPLYLGSVKTNVGHLDSAAGIVGLMKVVLSLQHDTIPSNLNYSEPNKHIPWDDWPLEVPTENVVWKSERQVQGKGMGRFAGISAFGMSGTNVHLIVGDAPIALPEPEPPIAGSIGEEPAEKLLTLSSHAAGALPELASRYASMLAGDESINLQNVCFSAATARSHLAHRAAFVAPDNEDLIQQLSEFAAGNTGPNTSTGTVGRRPPRLTFLFTGQGAQHVGMGKALYENHAGFRAQIDRCADLLETHLDRPLLEILWSGETLHQTAYTQPALFAIEYSLAKLFEEWGVKPDLMLGHSIGEYAAACIAGVFSLEDALRLVCARGRLMQSLPTGGKMVSAATDEETVLKAIDNNPLVSIAAVNGPRSIVFSGDGDAIDGVVENLSKLDVKTTALKVSHAFHSPMMDPILEEFRAVAASVDFKPPTIKLISNVTGALWGDAQLTADYWVDHLRGAVRFADGIAYAQSKKFQTFVEIGPKPTLLGLGRSSVEGDYGTWLPSLKVGDEWATLLHSVSELHVCGVEIDWSQFYGHSSCQRLQLPNYPWRHQRCWTDVVSSGGSGQRLHPLVHRRIDNASRMEIFEATLSAENPAYLNDHRFFGNVVFPASAFFEMAMETARTILQQDDVALSNVSIGNALVLSEEPVTVQVIVTPDGDRYDFEICSRSTDDDDAEWTQHTTGKFECRVSDPAVSIDIEDTLKGFSEPVDLDEFSANFGARGLEYLPRFHAIEEVYKSNDKSDAAFARLELPADAELPGDSYRLHPVISDAAFRIGEAIFADGDLEQIYLPFGISRFSYDRAVSGTIWVKATARQEAQTRVVDLELFDEGGQRVASIEQLTLRSVSVFNLKRAMTAPRKTEDVLDEWLYHFTWEEAAPFTAEAEALNGDWLILLDEGGFGDQAVGAMQEQGVRVHSATNVNEFEILLDNGDLNSVEGIVHLWGLDACENAPDGGLHASLQIVQSLTKASISSKHWFVTKGAQSVTGAENISPWQTRFWGFGRTLQVEQPDQFGGCIDIDPALPSAGSDNLDLLLAQLGARDLGTEIAVRNSARLVARLAKPAPDTQNADTNGPLKLNSDASYLVTGGLGALGLVVAQYLASCGAKHLVLTGRREVSSDAQRDAVQSLEDAGVKVDVVAADISQADDVGRVLAAMPKLAGIVHAAGVLDDAMIMQQDVGRFTKIAGPKVDGSWQLHSQTLDRSLDFFVLFSSVASVMGSPGQANYASANAFMDGLAYYRHHQGLPVTAINWGPWADVGMAASDIVLQRLMNDGWQPMSGEQGCEFIAHLLTARPLPQAAVLPVDWAQFTQRVPGAGDWSSIKHLVPQKRDGPAHASAAEKAAEQVKLATGSERVDAICAYLLERIAQTLRVQAKDLDSSAQLGALGVDSLTAVELRLWVQGDLGVELAVEQLFVTPSIRDLAGAVDQLMGGDAVAGQTVGTDEKQNEKPSWIVRPKRQENAQSRLFCFPFAGGGASAFKDWADSLPEHIEVCVVQLPGREERLAEAPLTDMGELVTMLTDEILNLTDLPFAFFGHSMGAIVAYETACRLRQQGASLPSHLFVSARAAPQLENRSDPLRFLENAEFMERLHGAYGAVPEAIRNNAALQDVFLPILRADVALLETHIDGGAEPLACPITAMGGKNDPTISAKTLAGWSERTNANFVQHEFGGDHFYINAEREPLIAAILEGLASGGDKQEKS